MDEVQQVTVEVVEEDEAVALGLEGFAAESDALLLEEGVGGVEIVVGDGEVADASVFVIGGSLGGGEGPVGGDDFEHGAVGSLDEIVAGVGVVDVEAEVGYVPFGEGLRVGGGDGGVFETVEHKGLL